MDLYDEIIDSERMCELSFGDSMEIVSKFGEGLNPANIPYGAADSNSNQFAGYTFRLLTSRGPRNNGKLYYLGLRGNGD